MTARYQIVSATTTRIEEVSVYAWLEVMRTYYPESRWHTRLVGVRNYMEGRADGDGWIKPEDFLHGAECVERVHAAYRENCVQLLVRTRKLDVYI